MLNNKSTGFIIQLTYVQNYTSMTKNNNDEALRFIKILYDKKTKNDRLIFNVSTLIEINVLRSLLNLECEDYHIRKAIINIEDINKIDIQSFEDIINNIVKNDLEKDQQRTWQIIIPFEVNFNRKVITINGIRFNILSFSTLRKKFTLEYYQFFRNEKIDTKEIEDKKCKYLLVESRGRTLYNAWKRIEPTFGVIRGLLDFGLSYNQWKAVFILESRTKIPYPETVFGTSTSSEPSFLFCLLPF